ncbi:hypothetical protein U2W12_01610 [Methylomicrobium sp. Wu6]|nr:hypothetical protein [Methylomicrobium sp. Wu6]
MNFAPHLSSHNSITTTMTLLTRLYRYRTTELRNPTEDFLSEAFVEWLQLAGDAGLMQRVLSELLGLSQNQCLAQGDEGRNIRWNTQHVIGPGYRGFGKRPDIVGQSDNFFLIIENKVGAAFTQYVDGEGKVGQLDLYADYQHRQGKPHGGIVLLTHYTSAPEGWTKPVVTWRDIHRWLSSLVPQLTKGTSASIFVLEYWTKNLIKFLEENEMTGTSIALSDIIAMPAFDRLRKGMRNLGVIARKELTGRCINGQNWRTYSLPYGGTSGEFSEPHFYGVLMTPDGNKAHDSAFILWSGVLAADAYEITPHINGIPELSVGFGAWTDSPLDDPDCIAAKESVKKQLAANALNMEWNCEWKPRKSGVQKGVLIVQARLSLIELHCQAREGFWDDPTRSFFNTACDALFRLPEETWAAIEKIVDE